MSHPARTLPRSRVRSRRPWWHRLLICVPAAACVSGCVPVFQRTLPDLVYSGITGRDCSLVRLDRGESYCRPVDLPPAPQPYCTRSLGGVDCWAHPELVVNLPPQVAQLPHEADPGGLSPGQDRVRLARWPADLLQ